MPRANETVGPYKLIRRLGKGAFGEVWLAERTDVIAAPQYAIKFHHDDKFNLEDVTREARLWVQASGHPYILPIVEANVYDQEFVLVSEYASEGSLEDWLRGNGGLAPSIELTVEIVSSILAGLEHLHQRQVIHRDLKPANILMQGSIPRLADFGLSRVLKSTMTTTGNWAGTPSYMAPEAFKVGKENRTLQTDVWSAGVILYEMLVGRLPFQASDLFPLINEINNQDYAPLPDVIPVSLRTVIDLALQKDPARRFTSALEMREALRQTILNPTAQPVRGAYSIYLDHGVEIEMVNLPGSTFLMGSEEFRDTKPIHSVTLSPFHMGKYPITQAQWLAVIGSNPSLFKGDDLPVEQVSWEMATEFCEELSKLTGSKYRLPTEAEWEYACRAGATEKYCFGNDATLLKDYAWYQDNSDKQTHPVGQKKPIFFGLYDMHGNVWEWCQDWRAKNYYSQSPSENPQGPSVSVDSNRIVRGGDFSCREEFCCSALRDGYFPHYSRGFLGFRVVCVAEIS